MARTPDPTGLNPEEAHEFRAMAREVRRLKGITNEQLAEYLEWDVRQVTSAFSEGRTLLAAKAIALAKALAELHANKRHWRPAKDGDLQKADTLLLRFWATAGWVRDHRHINRPVAAVIPRAECERFAANLIDVISRVPGVKIGEQKRRGIEAAIKRHLLNRCATMAMTWNEITGSMVHRIVEEAATGEGEWAEILNLFDRTSATIARIMDEAVTGGDGGAPALKLLDPAMIAREAVYVAATVGMATARPVKVKATA